MRRRVDEPVSLDGEVWLAVGGRSLGGPARIALLRAIAEHGSITHAARAVGLSYKAAWDTIDRMNGLAGRPLVERSAGGRGGGSTRLTEHGRRLVERFGLIEGVHRRFVRLLSDEAVDLDQDFDLFRVLNMRTSARNHFVGTVSGFRTGAVNDEIELALPGGARLVAVVTRESTELLGLRPGATAFALVDAASVVVATDLGDARLSARNRLPGTVLSVAPGAVNAEVTIALEGGSTLAAIVTLASARELGLGPGRAVTAVFKASSVILGTLA